MLFTEPRLPGPMSYYLALLAKFDEQTYLALTKPEERRKPSFYGDRQGVKYRNAVIKMEKNINKINFCVGNIYLLQTQLSSLMGRYTAGA